MIHKPVQAVIFDFNGTLFLDGPKHVEAWSIISEKLRGRPLTEQELHESLNGLPNHMIIRYLSGNTSTPELEQKYSVKKEEIYRDLCRNDPEHFHLIDGAQELFDALKAAGIPFTIASASIKDNIDFFVESFHLDKWIRPEDIQFDDGRFPDKTHMLLSACNVMHVSPEQTTIIEDSISGVKAARAAGLKDIRIINSAKTPEVFEELQVDEIAEDMNGLHLL
ncbi:HAD family hydrolase [Allobaculum mucilyticum]|uniref:HAD family hydrolase n=1 Tax=Allobaculum mucilyticum TaxID=2834459 RepID=UPI001E31DD25|nr:HAD family phosphatase [Allobaculum mucilyticum]UNT96177.1 HAD family phosphatase [Allobaculum mucilyticum]